MDEFIAVQTIDLERVCGGGSSWDNYVRSQRAGVAAKYKQVVCSAAGVKGGRELATQVYGADRTTGSDMVRAAETLKSVCMGGARLPEQAPATPF